MVVTVMLARQMVVRVLTNSCDGASFWRRGVEGGNGRKRTGQPMYTRRWLPHSVPIYCYHDIKYIERVRE